MLARSLLSEGGSFEDVSYKSAIALVSIAHNHTVVVWLLFLVSLNVILNISAGLSNLYVNEKFS